MSSTNPEVGAKDTATPVIDSHIHLFDTMRPEGVPWPPEEDPVLYQPALPSRLREVTKGLGVVGAIEVECSPWLEDNQWVLDVAASDTVIVGTVGDLEPGRPEFRKQLERFHRDPLFLGIRCGNLWDRDLSEEIKRSEFISDLKALAEAGLELDAANPDPTLIAAVVRLTDRVPDLRVVMDHLPQLQPPAESEARNELRANLEELGARPQVYAKISAVLRRVGDSVPLAPEFYRQTLDELWRVFGDNRVIYGSDWPNSDQWGPYKQAMNVVREYVKRKDVEAAEKFFWKNSVAAYRWVRRDERQPRL